MVKPFVRYRRRSAPFPLFTFHSSIPRPSLSFAFPAIQNWPFVRLPTYTICKPLNLQAFPIRCGVVMRMVPPVGVYSMCVSDDNGTWVSKARHSLWVHVLRPMACRPLYTDFAATASLGRYTRLPAQLVAS